MSVDVARLRMLRMEMVRDQIEARGVREPRLLEALRSLPRHLFVPPNLLEFAYEDRPLPIGEGQTISQPYIVALMTDLLELEGGESVLEIGTGSGYQAALLGMLAGSVHSVERHAGLAERARGALAGLNLGNVHVHDGDGSLGWPEAAPYQGILVTAAAPKAPPPLLDQLAEGGVLVLPVGSRQEQSLQRLRKLGQHIQVEFILPVAFVPLRGVYGFQEDQWPEKHSPSL